MRTFQSRTSDERFSEMLRTASYRGANGERSDGSQLHGVGGVTLGSVERKRSSTRFNLTDREFALFVEQRLADLHQEFLTRTS